MVSHPYSFYLSSFRFHILTTLWGHPVLFIAVIERYQYRVENEKGARIAPDIKDFKRLNKVVLKEGATNAAVSNLHPYQKLNKSHQPLTFTFFHTG